MLSVLQSAREEAQIFPNQKLEKQTEGKRYEGICAHNTALISAIIGVFILINLAGFFAPVVCIVIASVAGISFAIALISYVIWAVGCKRFEVLNKELQAQKQMFNNPPVLSLEKLQTESSEDRERRFSELGMSERLIKAVSLVYEAVKDGMVNCEAFQQRAPESGGYFGNLFRRELWTIKRGTRSEIEVITEEFKRYVSLTYEDRRGVLHTLEKTPERVCRFLALFYPEIPMSQEELDRFLQVVTTVNIVQGWKVL
jgi:hypothetical protein